jgi:predicted transglutaminase-like cysteine proteinase
MRNGLGGRRLGLASVGVYAAWLMGLAPAGAESGPRLSIYGPSKVPPGAERLCVEARLACGGGSSGSVLGPADEMALAQRINAAVNARMSPVRDPSGIGASWTPPQGDVGDCKHYAVRKKLELVRAGIDARRLLLAVVAGGGADLHAVLVYRTAEADLVLDDLTDRLLGWRESGYTFLKMQSPAAPSRWDLVLEGPRARRG